jgi:hypothetical protein
MKRLPLCLLLVVAVYALAAQGAAAQTAYECAPAKPGVFKDAHCKEQTNPAEGFAHVAIPANVSIPITWTNETTGGARSTIKMKSIQSGVILELQSTEATGKGVLVNRSEGATTWAEGSGTVVYKHVTMTAPAGKGCKVKSATGEAETITTRELSARTIGLNQLKYTPASEGPFAEFIIEGCSIGALNHAYTVTGSFVSQLTGTTTNTTHENVTAQGTLFLFGQKAGLEFSTTAKLGNGNGIALT